jgi:hypothetical protein
MSPNFIGGFSMIKKASVFLGIAIFFLAFPAIMFADSIILGPTDFVPELDSTLYLRNTGILYARTGGSGSEFYAPVHFPDGVRITSVVFFYKDDSSIGNVEVYLYKKNIYNQNSTVMGYYFSHQSAPGLYTHKISPITGGNLVNNGGYFYSVRIIFTNLFAGEDCAVYAVKINYN